MKVENSVSQDCCPLCQSNQISRTGFAEYGGEVMFSMREINLGHTPEVWACNLCSSGFVQNIIPEAIAASLYSSSQAGQRWSSIPFEQQKTQEVIDAMTDVFKGKGRVLDIGCNTGELLDFAQGFGCVTSGLEYSGASREIISGKGHVAYSDFDQVSSQFEVITAFDLVEHLYNVPKFLNSCHDRLVSGGKLIMLTGDILSVSARSAGAHWWYAQYPEHIVFPSRFYFEKLGNFRLKAWLPTFVSIGYILPRYRVLLSRLKRIVTMRKYNGLPTLSPDHALIILTKVDL